MLVLMWGCSARREGAGASPAAVSGRRIIPPGIAGTVSEFANLVGGARLTVKGYGVVVGLGKAGSSEVPASLRRYMTHQLLREGLGSVAHGTGPLTPARLLADKDTAVVLVWGRIPPAAPVGTYFDLRVESMSKTQTLSLDGGVLMGTELRVALGRPLGEFGKAKTWAQAKGAIFVNPFLADRRKGTEARLRTGIIPGGGVVTRQRNVRLELRRPDYRMASLIQRRINERFGGSGKIAVAKTPAMIELRVPESRRDDYAHFLRLVKHVYLIGGPGSDERYAKQLARAIVLPTARHEDIALTWEAMGRQVALPIVRKLYASDNVAAAFYACRTGLRLDDALAVDAMVQIAARSDPTFQIPAIGELGRAARFIQVVPTLRRLLASPNELIRVAAYEALMEHGTADIRSETVSGGFVLDLVPSERDFVVYATRTGQPKVVLFGPTMPVRRPVFYCPSDELVTINARAQDRKLVVFRKVPRSGRMSDGFDVPPVVADLVRTLGRIPNRGIDGKIEGLGLTYSQVVGVLYGLCKAEHIPARFVLQQTPEVRRLYGSVSAVGRPDMPVEDNE